MQSGVKGGRLHESGAQHPEPLLTALTREFRQVRREISHFTDLSWDAIRELGQQMADLLPQPGPAGPATRTVSGPCDPRTPAFAAITHGGAVADVISLPHRARGRGELAAAVAAFCDHADLAPTTRRVSHAALAALVDGLGPTRPMPELTADLLDGWFRVRYATAAPATWNRE